jgi:hypothetical protein
LAALPTALIGITVSPLLQLVVLVAIVTGGAITDTIIANSLPCSRGRVGARLPTRAALQCDASV